MENKNLNNYCYENNEENSCCSHSRENHNHENFCCSDINNLNNEKSNSCCLPEDDLNAFTEKEKLEKGRKKYHKAMSVFLLWNLILGLLSFELVKISNSLFVVMIIPSFIALIFVIFMYRKEVCLKNELTNSTKKPKLIDMITLFGIGYLLTIIFGFVGNFLSSLLPFETVDVTGTILANLSIELIIYTTILGPILEELLFRGIFLKSLSKYGKTAAILLSTILFAFAHSNVHQSIAVIGMGLTLGYAAVRFGLIYSIILHIIHNSMVTIVGFLVAKNSESLLSIPVILIITAMIIGIVRLFNHLKSTKTTKENKEFELKSIRNLSSSPIFYIFIIVMSVATVISSKLIQ